ncbi:acyl-coenzyme A:6-aminopenicillanic acid acyl-transferase-domain-containing protein [Aspergillus cavernicola]|uniref:Acyl-coenzyme A:6-aminopenicillanic acid acyl-transferase-domain-containing protein n=1 Tax=Aspergillus cavernicola TaxID=176166 RepID=A0ABR4I4N4_9EURO
MPPHIPTLTLHGPPYTIGLEHGQQAASLITKNIKTYTAFFHETANLSWSDAKTRAATFIPTLKTLYPAILDEIRGIADGSGLDFTDILALNIRSEIALTNYDNTPTPPKSQPQVPEITDGCTALAQLSGDGSRLVLAQNWDWVADLADGTVVLDITIPGSESQGNGDGHGDGGGKETKRLFTLTEAGLVGKIGLNSSGLGVCVNALRCGAFDVHRLPTHIMARYILEHGAGVGSAVEMLGELGGACAVNMLVADMEGAFASVEVTPFGISVLRPSSEEAVPGDGFDLERGRGPSFVAHTNHVVTPARGFPRGAIYDRPAANSFSRLQRVTELARVDAERGVEVCGEAVYARLKDQEGDPYSICRGLPVNARGMERMTTLASVVIDMDVVEKRARGFVTVGRPCEEGLQRMEWEF